MSSLDRKGNNSGLQLDATNAAGGKSQNARAVVPQHSSAWLVATTIAKFDDITC
jgi:hypothetical protein